MFVDVYETESISTKLFPLLVTRYNEISRFFFALLIVAKKSLTTRLELYLHRKEFVAGKWEVYISDKNAS